MKIDVSVDITPEELRRFLGLPDVKPFQDQLMEQIQERVRAGTGGFDAESLMRPFLAPNLQTMDAMQKMFWKAMTGGRTADGDSKPPD